MKTQFNYRPPLDAASAVVNPTWESARKFLQNSYWRGWAGLVKPWVQSATGTVAGDFTGLRVVQRSL